MKMKILYFFLFLVFILNGCKESTPEPEIPLPKIRISDTYMIEGDNGNSMLSVDVTVSGEFDKPISFQVTTIDKSALAYFDYLPLDETMQIDAGQSAAQIMVEIIGDEMKEAPEIFKVRMSNIVNAEIEKSTADVTIANSDEEISYAADGYISASSMEGWDLVFQDEFTDAINPATWTYELGDGCPNLCGWGNNELQIYTDQPENSFIRDNKLVIQANKDNGFTSARMITKDKQTFNFGRLDIRAKLPKGQGIWPAIWLLGTNIDNVGWPACGEIDIVELVGHQPSNAHGTVHFGPAFPNNKSTGGTYRLSDEDFSDRFHVFSIVWSFDYIGFMIDDIIYKEVDRAALNGENYPFNNPFFMILNVATGGNWPGAPDETTEFPTTMELDYIRHFQRK